MGRIFDVTVWPRRAELPILARVLPGAIFMATVDSHPILILPGIGDSGPEHWQSRWQSAYPRMRRVVQQDWDRPRCDVWSEVLDAAVRDSGPGVVLVAHSLACLLVAHWAASTRRAIRGALLVAVPDPAGPAFPPEAVGFSPLPTRRLPFSSLIVASSNDPYGSLVHARHCASAWGSRIVEVGAAGHLNAASGLGNWPEGLTWLDSVSRD
jgi:predicted alpha/beta hydrolase family esterase